MSDPAEQHRRQGAIAVICREQRLLVIRRSQQVEAPGTYCFPGGAIEPGESPQDAVRRELVEELGVRVRPRRLLWKSITSWNVALSWWLTELDPQLPVRPNSKEVDQVLWLTTDQMRELPALLESNREFLDAWRQGHFQLWDDTPSV